MKFEDTTINNAPYKPNFYCIISFWDHTFIDLIKSGEMETLNMIEQKAL